MSDTAAPSPVHHAGIERVIGAIGWISRVAGVLGVVALVLMAVLILAEVVARNSLGTSIAISWDYAAYAMGAVFFLAAGDALRLEVHVRVTLLKEALPERAARMLDLVVAVVGFFLLIYITYCLFDLAYNSYRRGAQSFSVVATPLVVPQAILVVGSGIFTLQMLARILIVASGRAPKPLPKIGDHL